MPKQDEPERLAKARKALKEALDFISTEYNERHYTYDPLPDGIGTAEQQVRKALVVLGGIWR